MAALFFDVDGTLIDSFNGNRRITPAVRAELARVQGLGHKLFLSSGRQRLMLTTEVLEPGFDGMVLINGGYVELGGESVFEERMDPSLARATADFLEGLGSEYLIVAARRLYTRRHNARVLEFFSDSGHGPMFTLDYDLDQVLPTAIKMEALVPTEDRARVTALAAQALGPDICCDGHGGEGTYELYPRAISKAKGIEVLLGRLGMGPGEAYAFGDGDNDVEMLRYCGCGVAMGNAAAPVREAADLVCPPVWDDGLAHVLRELF